MKIKKLIQGTLYGFLLLTLAYEANAYSLIAAGELKQCCANGYAKQSSYTLSLELHQYEGGYSPTSSLKLFEFVFDKSGFLETTLELTSGNAFDEAVEFLTNTVDFGAGSSGFSGDSIVSSLRHGRGSSDRLYSTQNLFGLDADYLSGYNIEKLEVVVTKFELDETYNGGQGIRHDIRYDFNVYGTAVPLPAAFWLFGSALAGLGWIRRKQSV